MDIRNEQVGEKLYKTRFEQRIIFFLVCMGVITLTYGVLFVVDFLPEKPTETVSTVDSEPEATTVEKNVLQENIPEETPVVRDPNPVAIIFDSLDKRVNVLNPESRSIDDLDTALLSGAVRHPDSADFKNEGTIFLFGHSSYLPNVINKNFQSFNSVQNLKWGDTVRLQSSDTEYVYRIDRVYQVQASNAEIEIERGTAKLTLVTCNSFGSKDDRYIVEATQIDAYPL